MDESPTQTVLPSELARYAAVVAGLGVGRAHHELLLEYGFEADQFDRLEGRIEQQISRAMADQTEGMHPFLVAYEAALREAQAAALGPTALSLEQFAHAIGALERSQDPRHTLEKLRLQPEDLSRALAHFGPRLAKDPSLAQRFIALRLGKKPADPGS